MALASLFLNINKSPAVSCSLNQIFGSTVQGHLKS